MELGHIKQSIQPKNGMSSIIFRPVECYSFIELDAILLNKAFDELVMRIQLNSCTALESIMLQLFIVHCEMY